MFLVLSAPTEMCTIRELHGTECLLQKVPSNLFTGKILSLHSAVALNIETFLFFLTLCVVVTFSYFLSDPEKNVKHMNILQSLREKPRNTVKRETMNVERENE